MSAALQLPPPLELTIPEFLEWADTVDGLWQLRDGEPELMAPPSENHGLIQAELTRLIGNYLAAAGGRCRAAVSPGVIPKLRADRNMLVPDIAVTCEPPTGRHEMSAPLILVEILSPSNARQTRANLWAYTTIPSVAELLIVRSVTIGAELLRRLPDGTWPDQPETLGPEHAVRLDAIGFESPLRALYRTTLLA